MTLLSVTNLTVGYRTPRGVLKAVNDISFDMTRGRSLGFVGESGCGKTTIGMTLMGLLPENAAIVSGRIDFNGKDLATLSDAQWRRVRGKDIAMIFQAAMNALNPVYRVDEQVREAIRAHQPDIATKALDQRVYELFDLVKIARARMKDYPHQYSGGMKQRVIIAMALACRPRLIIADEPTTALDVIVQDQILKEIKEVQTQTHTDLIFISHDIAVVATVCDDICVMYGGQIVEMGQRGEVFTYPRHPYTKTLLAAYISLDNVDTVSIPAMREAPDQIAAVEHCQFAVNCAVCAQHCKSRKPAWIALSPTHKAFCCREDIIRKNHG